MGNPIQNNPLVTRADFERAAIQLIEPLIPFLTPGGAGLHLGESGAVYPSRVAEMEGFSRVLWAVVPMLAGHSEAAAPIWARWREGIIRGTDPAHPEYWGEIGPFDQRMVEMAAMGAGLCLAKQAFFESLPQEAQRNLHAWLSQINLHDMPQNNWRFFRVLVNTGLLLNGLPYSRERLDEDFALIEEHYEANGWYYDYFDQRDYYTPWGYHYYGLLYAASMRERDPERSERYIERARLFAPRFARWFAGDGEALPYGRSLTYRFAQGAFFSAMALAGVTTDTLGYGEVKGLMLRNLRKWLTRPIFTEQGVLSIGYGYPNLGMGEGYNAPGSPYWALKAFACLALPEADPFWACEERPYNPPDGLFWEPHARMLIERSAGGRHVVGYTAGNHAESHAHDESKYEKFAYSTHFAFSVTKCVPRLLSGAFDSMLALSMDGLIWHPRYKCSSFEVMSDRVVSVWHPFPMVTVRTEIVPHADWHLRVHRIETPFPLLVADGGFAIRRDRRGVEPRVRTGERGAIASAPWGESGIVSLGGYASAELIAPEPNTNLLYPRTLLPTLRADIAPGETTLTSAVLGRPDSAYVTVEQFLEEVVPYADLG